MLKKKEKEKKDLVVFANKLTKKYQTLGKLKNIMIYFFKKKKKDKKNLQVIQNCWKNNYIKSVSARHSQTAYELPKSIKQSTIITQHAETLEKSNIVDIIIYYRTLKNYF